MPDWKKYLKENLSLPTMKDHRDERAFEEMALHLEESAERLVALLPPESSS